MPDDPPSPSRDQLTLALPSNRLQFLRAMRNVALPRRKAAQLRFQTIVRTVKSSHLISTARDASAKDCDVLPDADSISLAICAAGFRAPLAGRDQGSAIGLRRHAPSRIENLSITATMPTAASSQVMRFGGQGLGLQRQRLGRQRTTCSAAPNAIAMLFPMPPGGTRRNASGGIDDTFTA